MTYDLVYITYIPSFYKINLLNRIAQNKKIYVIFLKSKSLQRNDNFYKGERNFEWSSLDGTLKINQIVKLIKLYRKIKFNSMIICGWNNILLWVYAFLSPRRKNAVVIESSIFESNINGLKGFVKKVFLSRISKAYCSGEAQKQLMSKLYFKGKIIITKGVGIFNIVKQPVFYPKEQVKSFIYVGRLSPEKNLKYLIQIFNELPYLTLNIVGYGPLEGNLREIGNSNIIFHGAIDNSLLPEYYFSNDAFILPSLSEPWGLVIEEALNNGIPVIVSENVGCSSEIVIQDFNGIIFSLSEMDSLKNAILKMQNVHYYNTLRKNVSLMDFEKNAAHQVACYININQ